MQNELVPKELCVRACVRACVRVCVCLTDNRDRHTEVHTVSNVYVEYMSESVAN